MNSVVAGAFIGFGVLYGEFLTTPRNADKTTVGFIILVIGILHFIICLWGYKKFIGNWWNQM